jgi:hypothetical protein
MMSARPGCLGVSGPGGLKGLALVLVILSSLVLSSSSETRVQHTSVSISVSRVTIYQGGITSRQNDPRNHGADRATDGSSENNDASRQSTDPGGPWTRGDVTEEESPLGKLSQAPVIDNNFTKYNILQQSQISDDYSVQETTTTLTTPTIKFKPRLKTKSKSEKFAKNQSVAERNYQLLRQKYNKKARSTTAATTTTISTTTATTTTISTTTFITSVPSTSTTKQMYLR